MSESTDWQDETYERVFEEELRGLERRRAHGPALTLEDIRMQLHHLYILDGQNLDRGAVGDIMSAATVSAYEHFIAVWEQELRNPPNQPAL